MKPHDRYIKHVNPETREVFTNSITTPTVDVFFKLPDGQYTYSGKEIMI
jgi:hypothetical protein